MTSTFGWKSCGWGLQRVGLGTRDVTANQPEKGTMGAMLGAHSNTSSRRHGDTEKAAV
jgi:hypothetical protein